MKALPIETKMTKGQKTAVIIKFAAVVALSIGMLIIETL